MFQLLVIFCVVHDRLVVNALVRKQSRLLEAVRLRWQLMSALRMARGIKSIRYVVDILNIIFLI